MIETKPRCPLCTSENVEHNLLGLRTHCLDSGAYTCDVHQAARCPKGVCWPATPTPDPVQCYRPKAHQGNCGEPIDEDEDEQRILYGRCGAPPAPTAILYAKDRRR